MERKKTRKVQGVAETNLLLMGKPGVDGVFPGTGRRAAEKVVRVLRQPGKHVDHIVPIAKGGTNHAVNLEAIPARANLAKGTSVGYGRLARNAAKKNVLAAAAVGGISYALARRAGADHEEAAQEALKESGKTLVVGTVLTAAMATPLAPVVSAYVVCSTVRTVLGAIFK